MSRSEEGSRPAFPVRIEDPPAWPEGQPLITEELGLSKREIIAAMALQGLAPKWSHQDNANHVAFIAVKFADALIDELDKDPKR
jgi:hypothetical protein